MAESDGVFYVEHVSRAQASPHGVDVSMRSLAEADGMACRVREEQEPGASGKAVIAAWTRALVGFNYGAVSITGSKVVRSGPFRSQAEAGNVRLVRGEWNEAYLQELAAFPHGAHGDQVDASSCAFNELAEHARRRASLADLASRNVGPERLIDTCTW